MKRFHVFYPEQEATREVEMADIDDHEDAAKQVLKNNWSYWEHPDEVDLVVTLIEHKVESAGNWKNEWLDKPVKVNVTVEMEPMFYARMERER